MDVITIYIILKPLSWHGILTNSSNNENLLKFLLSLPFYICPNYLDIEVVTDESGDN